MIGTQAQADSSVVCRPFSPLDWVGSDYLRDAICHTLRHGVQVVLDQSGPQDAQIHEEDPGRIRVVLVRQVLGF